MACSFEIDGFQNGIAWAVPFYHAQEQRKTKKSMRKFFIVYLLNEA